MKYKLSEDRIRKLLEIIIVGKRKFGEINNYLSWSHSTLSRYLKGMKEKGILQEINSNYHITVKGRNLFLSDKEAILYNLEKIGLFDEGVTEEDIMWLIVQLYKILDNFTEADADYIKTNVELSPIHLKKFLEVIEFITDKVNIEMSVSKIDIEEDEEEKDEEEIKRNLNEFERAVRELSYTKEGAEKKDLKDYLNINDNKFEEYIANSSEVIESGPKYVKLVEQFK